MSDAAPTPDTRGLPIEPTTAAAVVARDPRSMRAVLGDALAASLERLDGDAPAAQAERLPHSARTVANRRAEKHRRQARATCGARKESAHE